MHINKIINQVLQKGGVLNVESGKLILTGSKGAFSAELVQSIKNNKQEIIDHIEKINSNSLQADWTLPDIKKNSKTGKRLLSYAQQRLWFIDQLEGGSSQYNIAWVMKLFGELNITALKAAISTIIERHEILRSNFIEDNNKVYQAARELFNLNLEQMDLSALPASEQKNKVQKLAVEEAQRLFDLRTDLMLRVQLLKLSDKEHVMLSTMHHVASDGWSMSVFFSELGSLYKAYSEGRDNPLLELPVQYADYAQWQRDWLQGEVLQKQLGYWQQKLAQIPPVHSLPLDYSRPSQQSFTGAVHHAVFVPALTKSINTFCQSHDVTLFMLLQTVFALLISRYSNERDIVIGAPIAGRDHSDTEGLIGFFVNTLILRAQFDSGQSFAEVLSLNKQSILDAFAHQHIPIEMLVEELKPERSLSYSPIFQILFSVQNESKGATRLPGLQLSLEAPEHVVVKFDLELTIVEGDDQLTLAWTYNTDLFKPATIERLAASYQFLLENALKNAHRAIDELPVLPPQEVNKLHEWNATTTVLPVVNGIHQLFEQQVETNPEAIAVVMGDRELSYQQLNEQANRLAHYLLSRGIKIEQRIGVGMQRCPELIIAVLGILKAGGAYVPMDTTYPRERLDYMADDAHVQWILTTDDAIEANKPGIQVLSMDKLHAELDAYDNSNPGLNIDKDNLAYVIYTSGSTGRPKGVFNIHGGLLNLASWHMQAHMVEASHCGSWLASIGFDASTWEIWPYLSAGARLCVVNDEQRLDPEKLLVYLNQHKVTHCFMPTPLAERLTTCEWPAGCTLEVLLVGGEKLNGYCLPEDVGTRLINHYGPSETAVVGTYAEILKTHSGTPPIGRPIANMQMHVLDSALIQVPCGVVGELYLSGRSLARGYANNAGLTALAFIPNPYGQPGSRMYRTGDLVRYRADGDLEYVGRIDHQVKLRGFRIELGEIESALEHHAGVESGLVQVVDSDLGQQLVGYITTEQSLEEAKLKQSLQQVLPSYMVPMAIVQLESFPLTANGKVDRERLPSPDWEAYRQSYVGARDEVEHQLVSIFESLLPVDRVGIDDNFFELGGHSLLATQLISKVRQQLDVELPLRVLFEQPTVAGLSAQLGLHRDGVVLSAIERVDRDADLALSYAQQRLWFIDQLEGGSSQYNMPVAYRLKGELNTAAFMAALDTIVERHEVLRTHFEVREDQTYQVIVEGVGADVEQLDLSDLDDSDQLHQVQQLAALQAQQDFDLSSDVMLRVQLIKLSEVDHVVLSTMHHVASDGWSMGIFFRELSHLYRAYSDDQEPVLPELPVQYADYARWQRDWLSGEVLSKQLGYWEQQLSGVAPVHNLPLDHSRPNTQSFVGQVHRVLVDADLSQRLRDYCQSHEVTMFMLLETVFALLVSRYSGEDDIVIGTPIAGRDHGDTEGLIGFFVNTLVLRTGIQAGQGFGDLLKANKQTILDAYTHQHIPFEMLVEELKPERSLSHGPIFQLSFTLHKEGQGVLELAGLELGAVESSHRIIKFDLELNVAEHEGQLILGWNYNTDLFELSTIERLSDSYRLLLEGILLDADRAVGELPLLSADQQQQLRLWNATDQMLPGEQGIHELFELQASNSPDAIAVVMGDDQLSYQQLNEQANQLAGYLLDQGVRAEDRIGVCMHRSPQLLVALLGILKSGAAYVPLDPEYPSERLIYMLSDSKASYVLIDAAEDLLSGSDAQKINISDLDLSSYSDTGPLVQVQGDQLGYVIYTSGSTGQPKGVCIRHGGALGMLSWALQEFGRENLEGVLASTSICFDLSVYELFAPLSVGGKVVLAKDALSLLDFDQWDQVSLVNTVPSAIEALVGARDIPRNVRVVNLAGEALSAQTVEKVYASSSIDRLYNLYGPSEDTTYSTGALIERGSDYPSIGGPISNSQVYVLDSRMSQVPVGVTGELYMGGLGLSRGYLDRGMLTAERFVPNPYGQPGSRMYRTGDLVRYRADGDLEYVGRIDHQVKLRGFRIELGEIESALEHHAGVDSGLVQVVDSDLGQQLVGYITTEQPLEEAKLKQSLQQVLPSYMVPMAIVQLESFPLTANGKVDRERLPSPDWEAYRQSYVGARDEVEHQLVSIFESLLPVDRVGIDDNFFELGGDSIISIQLVSRARQLGLTLSVRDVFTHQTVRALAPVVEQTSISDAQQDVVTGPVALTPIQHWFAEADYVDAHHWNQAMLFRLPERFDKALLEPLLTGLINHHDALRMYYPAGWESQTMGAQLSGMELGEYVLDESEAIEVQVHRIGTQIQGSLDMQTGQLVAGCVMRLPDGSARLLLAIHHMGVDGVSWRILQEDMRIGYAQLSSGQSLSLPAKSHSYQAWSEHLHDQVSEGLLESEREYWQEQVCQATAVYVEHPEGSNRIGDSKGQSVSLSKGQTEQLLKQVNNAYRTQIDDVLLTALLLAYREWTGADRLSVHLEGHGREQLGEGLDITRTVGWFTSLYPVTLSHADGAGLGESLMGVKEQLRSIPNKGIGYGLLRYLHPDKGLREQLIPSQSVGISFNYLGQFQSGDQDEGFVLSGEGVGESVSREQQRSDDLSLVSSIREDCLQLSCNFSGQRYEDASVGAFLSSYIEHLSALIEHCMQPDVVGRTPSDYRLCQLTQGQLDDLRVFMDDRSGDDLQSIYPLSPVQQGMLFHSEAEQGAGHYVVQMGLQLRDLEPQVYRQAWEQLLSSHGVLRTLFWDLEGEHPQQVIAAVSDLPWLEEDWSDVSESDRDDRWFQLMHSDREQGFAADQSPLMRCYLVNEGEGVHRFMWSYHHALLDGWSMPLVLRDLSRLYRSGCRGEQLSLKPAAQFIDYIGWLMDQDQQQAKAFWVDHLSGMQAPTPLSFGASKVGQAIVEQAHVGMGLSQAHSEHLQSFAQAQHVTLNTLLQSMWGLLLSRYSGEDEVLFGMTVSGRPADLPGVGEIIGPFISTLPVRVSVDQTAGVLGYLESFQQQHVQREQYGYLPLVQIQQCSQMAAGVPMFETLVVYENYPTAQLSESEQSSEGARLQVTARSGQEQAHYPITLIMAMQQGCLQIAIYYDAQRFEASVMDRLLGHYRQLLEQLLEDVDQPLSQLSMLSADEQQQLRLWNATDQMLPGEQGIHELFELQASNSPDAIAVVMEDHCISYGELNRRANQLAGYLLSQGVSSEERIGVCMDRSVELIIALLGILKSGGVYVPLDMEYPTERLAYMVQDAGVDLVLTHSDVEVARQIGARALSVDSLDKQLSGYSVDNPGVSLSKDNLAYVIYTSGSTGQPKGVVVTHQGITRLLFGVDYMSLDSSVRILQASSVSFDASTLEIWGGLLHGGCCILLPGKIPEAEHLRHSISEQKVNSAWLTSALFNALIDDSPDSLVGLRQLAVGGEAVSPQHVSRLYGLDDQVRIINGYGPTESTTFACCYEIPRSDEVHRSVPIGYPIGNTQCYVVDADLHQVPVGVVGELYLGGLGLARGYLDRGMLTAERFVPNPYGQPGSRMYRTGDLVRYRADGDLEYVGRIDHQVKLRGFRIELGEIESALEHHAGVDSGLVQVVDSDLGQQLVGYITTEQPLEEAKLKQSLQQVLPSYMVPMAIVQLESFPLTANGKVDRERLPSPDWEAYRQSYVAPRNAVESRLIEIYQELLSIEQIGINDDFFELGGHSLLATRLVSQIREEFDIELPLRVLFEQATVSGLALALDEYRNMLTMPAIQKAMGEVIEEEDEELEGEQF